MALTVTIYGQTIPDEPGRLRINKRRGSVPTASISVTVPVGTLPYPIGAPVVIDDTGTTVFSGEVTARTEATLEDSETGRTRFVLTCKGAEVVLDRVRVQGRYTETAAGDIFKDINTRYGFGYTVTDVDDGPKLETVAFEDRPTAKEAFNTIQRAATGYVWALTAAGSLSFKHLDDLTAANFTLSDSNKPVYAVKATAKAANYYNKVVVIGADGPGDSFTEFVGPFDAATESWTTKHRVCGNEDVDAVDDLSNAYPVGAAGEVETSFTDATGKGPGFLFNRSTNRGFIRLAPLPKGDRTIEFTYCPNHQLVYAYKDKVGAAANGVHEKELQREGIRTIAEAFREARAFLFEHRNREDLRVVFKTAVDPGEPGYVFRSVDWAAHRLAGDYAIESVTASETAPNVLEYTVTISRRILPTLEERKLTALTDLDTLGDLDNASETRVIATETETLGVVWSNTMAEV